MTHATPTTDRAKPQDKIPGRDVLRREAQRQDLRERVLAQRRHILLQTGRDPLCGGLDD